MTQTEAAESPSTAAASPREAFERQIRAMARLGTGFEARMHNIADNGRVVLTGAGHPAGDAGGA